MEGKAKDLLLLNALLHLMKELAAQSRVILKKLTVPHLVNKFPVSFLMEPKGSLPCSQKTTTDPYHEPDKIWFTPPHPISSSSILILYFHFCLGFLVYFLQILPTKKICMPATCPSISSSLTILIIYSKGYMQIMMLLII